MSLDNFFNQGAGPAPYFLSRTIAQIDPLSKQELLVEGKKFRGSRLEGYINAGAAAAVTEHHILKMSKPDDVRNMLTQVRPDDDYTDLYKRFNRLGSFLIMSDPACAALIAGEVDKVAADALKAQRQLLEALNFACKPLGASPFQTLDACYEPRSDGINCTKQLRDVASETCKIWEPVAEYLHHLGHDLITHGGKNGAANIITCIFSDYAKANPAGCLSVLGCEGREGQPFICSIQQFAGHAEQLILATELHKMHAAHHSGRSKVIADAMAFQLNQPKPPQKGLANN